MKNFDVNSVKECGIEAKKVFKKNGDFKKFEIVGYYVIDNQKIEVPKKEFDKKLFVGWKFKREEVWEGNKRALVYKGVKKKSKNYSEHRKLQKARKEEIETLYMKRQMRIVDAHKIGIDKELKRKIQNEVNEMTQQLVELGWDNGHSSNNEALQRARELKEEKKKEKKKKKIGQAAYSL